MPESRAFRSSRRREDIRRCCRHSRLLLNSRQSLKHAEVLGDIYRLTDKNASPFRAILTRRPCAVGKIRRCLAERESVRLLYFYITIHPRAYRAAADDYVIVRG